MALVVAALAAEGQSRIESVDTIERGYARLAERLRDLGAAVEREA
jgi:UDP-N-acetylglucosamine 1-carboxyvinyltransferase